MTSMNDVHRISKKPLKTEVFRGFCQPADFVVAFPAFLHYIYGMSNILDYIVWRGDLSFEESAFNEIDALILCQISYLNFDGLLADGDFSKKVTLSELAGLFKKSADFEKRCDTGLLINRLTVKLMFDAAASRRFGGVGVTGYVSIIDLKNEEQFSAVTYLPQEKMNFIAYRGTDDTIVGWKEDFNLAILDEVPAQKDAVKYLDKAMSVLKGSFVVGGHSKGGNLAVYACSKACETEKKRIELIYNMDGPGFSEKRLHSQEFYSVIPKVRSYYPHFSIVGMLFDHAGTYSVVESDESGIMQHDPFSWHLLGCRYVVLDGFDDTSRFFHDTFNTWISQMPPEQRETFVETLFSIIQATDARTNSEIEQNIVENSVKIIRAIHGLDPELKDGLYKTLKMLFHIAHKRLPTFAELFERSELRNNARNAGRKVRSAAGKIKERAGSISRR